MVKIERVDCPKCSGDIEFEVYGLDDSPSGERFASFMRHLRPEWHCPYQWPELRRTDPEFQQLREDVLIL